MRCGLMLGLCLVYGCSLDTKPLVSESHSVTADRTDQSNVARSPSLVQTTRTGRFQDVGGEDAAQPADSGTKDSTDAAMSADAMPEPTQNNSKPDPMKMEAAGGGMAAAQGGGGAGGDSGRMAAGSGGAAGVPEAGAAAPTTSRERLIDVLMERASKNGPDAIPVRALIAQLDTPFPANAGSLRLLLATAITTFGCPEMTPECAAICEFTGDNCLTCLSDEQCRGQFVLACPNALMSCLP